MSTTGGGRRRRMPGCWRVEARIERRNGCDRWTSSRPLTYTAARLELQRLGRTGVTGRLVEARPPLEQRPRRCTTAPRRPRGATDPRQLHLFANAANDHEGSL